MLPVTKAPLHVPLLNDVAKELQGGLQKNFANVSVDIVDCPDLRQGPFSLASEGICGNTRIADVGGPAYLCPFPQRNKKYDFEKIGQLIELPGAFLIGAGAGPWHVVGVNCEMMANIKLSEARHDIVNGTWLAKVSLVDGSCVLERATRSEFCLMLNAFCSSGKPGKVLEVKATQRTGKVNFMSCLKNTLSSAYGTKPVGLGGAFLIERGKANLHIMPDFSKEALDTSEKVDKWLNFYEMDAPLVCVGEMVSHDPGLNLRLEHFHCFNDRGQGGHYHYDTTPNDVEYRGYFSLAESLYRIDQPEVESEVGKN